MKTETLKDFIRENWTKMEKKTKIKIISFMISFFWIGLGTLVHVSAYPDYNVLGFKYDSFIYIFLWFLTIPSNFILDMILLTTASSGVFIFQLVKVLIYWWLIYKILKNWHSL